MGVADRATVLAFLKSNDTSDALDIAGQRERMDKLSEFFPVPDGTSVEPGVVGGIKGEWVRAKNVRTDATLLYLHGGGYVVGSPKSHRHLVAALSDATRHQRVRRRLSHGAGASVSRGRRRWCCRI